MADNSTTTTPVWRESAWLWGSALLALALLSFAYADSLKRMFDTWETKEEYSYGYLIPFLALFLIWQKKDVLEKTILPGSWPGLLLACLAFVLFVVGDLSTLHLINQYSFVLMLGGLALAYTGHAGFRHVWFPLVLLFFMIPLPEFFLKEISANLQLVSSKLGVAVIRLFGISVFLEGNVIDLGSMKLQVVEACSGLRYLFPLMTLGFIAAYFFQARLWKRAIVLLSTIPITVLMNSLRIGIIGVLVEYGGKSQAEGFLHDFEGWVVFMACTALLVAEMWLLTRFGSDRRPLREVFGIDLPAPTPKDAVVAYRKLPRPYIGAMVLVAITASTAFFLPHRAEIIPVRQDFGAFPMTLGEWQGRTDRLEDIYLGGLKLDDYLLANYSKAGSPPVNAYVAYYASQRKGQSAHSPRTCIPGGGWQITTLDEHKAAIEGSPLILNRAVIQHSEQKQLVYYWFQQRGRVITNEYLVKWYIFWDALTKNRTDGAMVRLITPVVAGEDIQAADARLTDFLRAAQPKLPAYVPD